jgi:hypothetical protein
MGIRIEKDHKDWTTHEFKGLKDGGKTILNCKNCEAPLAEVWITLPDDKIFTEILAECPHCKSKSFKKKFYGAYHLGHTEYTTMIDFKLEGDVLTIQTAKGGNQWKHK